jgi:hypothetical protein
MKKTVKRPKRSKIVVKKRAVAKGRPRSVGRLKRARTGLADIPPQKSGEKKSRPKPRRSRLQRKQETGTGIEDDYGVFLGLENDIAGFRSNARHPRWTPEYPTMAVHQIVTRIRSDIAELIGRAFAPLYSQRSRFSREWRPRPAIKGALAESLCPGFLARIRSRDETERRRAIEEYFTCLDKHLIDEAQRAAKSIAFIAKSVAMNLENLFVRRPKLMQGIAAKFDLWPVNLGLRARRTKYGREKRALTRTTFAFDYLTTLGLNRW